MLIGRWSGATSTRRGPVSSYYGEVMLHHVTLFTDGACLGNPGPGGWSAILQCAGHEVVLSGHDKLTTNNRMEIVGVIYGLRRLTKPCEVTVSSDSQYLVDSITKWMAVWKSNGWTRRKKKRVGVLKATGDPPPLAGWQ
jgi:ribonuclease HI